MIKKKHLRSVEMSKYIACDGHNDLITIKNKFSN